MTEAALGKTVLRSFVSATTIFYGCVPAVVALNETYLFNLLWTEQARFHKAWFLAFTAEVSGIALFSIWRRDEIFVPIALGFMFAAGFWVVTLFRDGYWGALDDSNGNTHSKAGIESKTFLISVVTIPLSAALVAGVSIYRSSIDDG